MRYLVSALEMAELDRQTTQELSVPSRVLMEVAGRAVARTCLERLAPGAVVAVVCGTGNNGGDGFVAARAIAAAGHDVRVFAVGDPNRIDGDARAALTALERSGQGKLQNVEDARALLDLAAALDSAQLVVDALFGTGLRQDVRGIAADVIDLVNERARQVVAVDIPSGVDANTGAVCGRAVEADVTVTFAFAKRGHYLFPGAELRGELEVADIGVPEHLAQKLKVSACVVLPEDGPRLVPARRSDSHKGTFGTLLVVAGSEATPGAANLALLGALRSGAGLVRFGADSATVEQVRPPPEVILSLRRGEPPDTWAAAAVEGASALVVGPGLGVGPDRVALLTALLEAAQVPVCLDADALNILAAEPQLWHKLQAPAVLTPHPKEMARLTKQSVEAVQRDRVAAALQLAAARGCIVVLKGAGTIVAEPDGVVSVNAAGNPGLATGGTGDVLAGVIGGLLGQGLDPGGAARAAVLLHALAGERAASRHGQAGVIATDVAQALGEVWAEWQR